MNRLSENQRNTFQRQVWQYYRRHGRELPWRTDRRPYAILVSEFMLQQTQVTRVVPKFTLFLTAFPDNQTLAAAPLSEVLRHWLGLGYNRRARFLHLAAQSIERDHGGVVPAERMQLQALPGIGPNTAGAILAYAFQRPEVFIETNIRTVFIHHFYQDQPLVSDAQITELVHQTLDAKRPREWYWALMDYGTQLKAAGNNIARSRQYKKQSRFAGSLRQMRGELMRQLAGQPRSLPEIRRHLSADERLEPALQSLVQDGLVERSGNRFHLTGQTVLR